MNARRVMAVLALGPIALIGATACSGDDSAVSSEPTSVTTEEPPTAVSPTTVAVSTIAPVSTVPTTSAGPTTSPTVPALFDFTNQDASEGWTVVNDTVMGGVSSGETAWADGELLFTGLLSLENNGGFTSMRSPAITPASASGWATTSGPRVLANGDGRTWTMEVRTDDGAGGWIATLATSAGETTDSQLEWSDFEPVDTFLRPRSADGPIDPARIRSIGFYLVDGIEGPFTFGLRSIS